MSHTIYQRYLVDRLYLELCLSLDANTQYQTKYSLSSNKRLSISGLSSSLFLRILYGCI